MPNDTKTQKKEPKFLKLDVKVDEWIERFNKTKGWKRLKNEGAPSPEVLGWRDEEQKFRKDGKDYFEHRLETLGDTQELAQKIVEANDKITKLTQQLTSVTSEEDRKKIEAELMELGQSVKDMGEEIKTVERLEKSLETVKKVEAKLPEDLKATRKRILALEQRLDEMEEPPKLPAEGEDSFLEMQLCIKFHDDVAQFIEDCRQIVIPLTETGKDGIAVTRNFAAINSEEYKILYGMLEEARLTLQLGDFKGATAQVQATRDLAWKFRDARTGSTAVVPAESFGKDLDRELALARSSIDSLMQAGYEAAAKEHQRHYDRLNLNVRARQNSGQTDLETEFLSEASSLAEACAIDMDRTRQIAAHLAKANQHVEAMRANGHEEHPQRVVDRIDSLKPGKKLEDTVDEAEAIATYAFEQLERTKERDLRKAKIDPEKLEAEHKRATERFDAMFKHDKDGGIRQQTDTKTGLLKGVKKNADLPRETLEEIELRLKASEQLLQSDSVAALGIADTYVGNVNIFLDNIEKNPKWYAQFADWLKQVTSDLNKLEKSYQLYEVSRRADLKADLDKLTKDYLTSPQSEAEDRYTALRDKLGVYAEDCSGLQAKKRSLAKVADGIEKNLAKIGDVLKKDCPMNDPSLPEKERKFTGYHGNYVGELAEARSKIAGRTADTLKQAQDQLDTLNRDVSGGLKLLTDYVALRKKKGTGRMEDDDIDTVKALMKEAGEGQAKQYADEKAKPAFELAIKELEKQSGIVEGLQKKLKSDPSTLQALNDEIDALKQEAKADGNYVEALKKLQPMTARMARLMLDGESAGEVVDAKLADAAKLVAGNVTAFQTGAKEFFAKVLHPNAVGEDGTNLIDKGVYDEKKLKAFLDSLVAAIPSKAVAALVTETAVVADTKKSVSERKAARKAALAAVRSLMGALDGFKPAAHFRLHTFPNVNAVTALNAARLGLPRLEMRLLTAIDA